MKIIILAAGKGSRMMPLTRDIPKPLLMLENGKTLLEEQVCRMEESGVIDEVVFVVGYRAEKIEARLGEYDGGMSMKTIYNPFYELSNNLMSLWLARSEMGGDFLITNGDNLFHPPVFTSLVESCSDGIFLTTSLKDTYDVDDMKVIIRGELVARVHKEIAGQDADAESVGLVLVSGDRSRQRFVEALETLARRREYMNRYWLEIFNELSGHGVPIIPFRIDGAAHWQEFDFHWDFEKARKMFGISRG